MAPIMMEVIEWFDQTGTGIVHRYPDRLLLKVNHACAVYCRFCFRKESLTSIGRGYTREALEPALAYIADHSEIREVILTGGDPLSLPDKALAEIFARIEAIPHVRLLRIHTRVPVALPSVPVRLAVR